MDVILKGSLRERDAEDFDRFAAEAKAGHYTQTRAWADVSIAGRALRARYFLARDAGKVVGCGVLLQPRAAFLGAPVLRLERGPVCDDPERVAEVSRALCHAARLRGIGRVQVMPYWAGEDVELRREQEQIEAAIAARQQSGQQLLKEEVDADEIAEIVSRWTGVPVTKLVEGEVQKLVAALNQAEALNNDDMRQAVLKQLDAVISRMKALLRRLERGADAVDGQSTIELHDLVIDREKVLIFRGEETIELPKKEFEIIWLLASKPGKVFTREEIFAKIWGNDVIVGNRTIDVHIRKLRERIGENYIKTLKGIGYKFEF